MSRKIYFVGILLCLINISLQAQIKEIPEDSLAFYLSHKWQEKARFMGSQQIQTKGEKTIYDFKGDSSFVKTIGKKEENGTWKYNREKKIIHLEINNKTHFYIVHLTPHELLLSTELADGSNFALTIMVLLKPVQ